MGNRKAKPGLALNFALFFLLEIENYVSSVLVTVTAVGVGLSLLNSRCLKDQCVFCIRPSVPLKPSEDKSSHLSQMHILRWKELPSGEPFHSPQRKPRKLASNRCLTFRWVGIIEPWEQESRIQGVLSLPLPDLEEAAQCTESSLSSVLRCCQGQNIVSPEANLQAEDGHRIAFHRALESILVWSQGEKKALCHQLWKTHAGLGFFGVGGGAVNTWPCATFTSCRVMSLEPKVGQMFCPLWRCPCEPQCSDQTLHLCDCTEEVDLDMLKCKVFPSLLSSWLEGTKATSVPVQSFTAWSAWRQNCRQESRLSFLFIRHGYHFCKGRSKQSKPKKKSILISHVSDLSLFSFSQAKSM